MATTDFTTMLDAPSVTSSGWRHGTLYNIDEQWHAHEALDRPS
jgi:phosphatidylethanolamine-binding protein (PEBP) family uncharacterized protein